jgi:hypothetical protein
LSTVNGGSPLASDPGRRDTTSLEWSWAMAKSVCQKSLANIMIDAFSGSDTRGLD